MNESEKISIVVTSIFHPNKSLRALAAGANKNNWQFFIVGDVSSPKDFSLEGAQYFDIASQKRLSFKLAALCPEKHYTRKNIGYLVAIENGSTVIVETDDDNIPNPEFWKPREHFLNSYPVDGKGWANVYELYTSVKVWPRGFPLEDLHRGNTDISVHQNQDKIFSPVQQGLADENPDVDAVFRMTYPLPITFEKRGAFHLKKNVWCPFNSQNTTWLKDAFPLLYLPSFCSFRMTDIWRSFVAQRVMWECGWSLLFHDATVWQERNEHSLIKDFEQEVPGYLGNNRIRTILESLALKPGKNFMGDNMLTCYDALVKNNIISDGRELDLLQAWLDDLQSMK